MPIVDGKVVRSRYTKLALGELSSVDNPAQVGARATILKRMDDPTPSAPSLVAVAVAKYISSDDGAHTFDEVLRENKFSEAIWPMTSALQQAITSIVGDRALSTGDRETKITASVDEFLSAVRDIDPQVEKKLAELISKKDDPMNWEEIAKAAQAEVATLKTEVETLKAAKDKAEADAKAAVEENDKTKKALTEATDAVIKVGETEVRKSVVGDAQFSVVKALQDQAQTATLEKRASDEFSHVAGTATEKALVLKAAEAMPEDTKKAFDAIMVSAEAMAAGAFKTFGGRGGLDQSGDVEKAVATFKGKVSEIAKRDGISEMAAMRKARAEHPTEFAAAYPEQADAA